MHVHIYIWNLLTGFMSILSISLNKTTNYQSVWNLSRVFVNIQIKISALYIIILCLQDSKNLFLTVLTSKFICNIHHYMNWHLHILGILNSYLYLFEMSQNANKIFMDLEIQTFFNLHFSENIFSILVWKIDDPNLKVCCVICL